MGRSLTAERQLESALKSLLIPSGASESKARAAILIGHSVSDSRDHLLAIVPIQHDNEEETFISDHAEKVAEMLPGGINVLGVAIPDVSIAQLRSSQSRFKQLLTSVWKRSKCVGNSFWVELNGRGQQILLYYNKEAKKFRFHWLQASELQSTLQPGSDVKFIQDPPFLVCAESNIGLSLSITSLKDQSPVDIVHSCVRELCNSLLSSKGLVKGDMVPEKSDPLDKFVPKGLVKNKTSLMVHLLIPLPQAVTGDGNPEMLDDVIDVKVANGVHCKAYLPITGNWDDLVMALKLDGIKSLSIRENLLLDEVMERESSAVPSEQRMLLSQRVCLADPALRFTLSDYATLGETVEDIQERVWSVWGRKGKYTILYPEDYDGADTDKESTQTGGAENEEKTATGAIGNNNTWYTIVAVAVLVIGLLLALASFLLSS